jgi:hypothetical protein
LGVGAVEIVENGVEKGGENYLQYCFEILKHAHFDGISTCGPLQFKYVSWTAWNLQFVVGFYCSHLAQYGVAFEIC